MYIFRKLGRAMETRLHSKAHQCAPRTPFWVSSLQASESRAGQRMDRTVHHQHHHPPLVEIRHRKLVFHLFFRSSPVGTLFFHSSFFPAVGQQAFSFCFHGAPRRKSSRVRPKHSPSLDGGVAVIVAYDTIGYGPIFQPPAVEVPSTAARRGGEWFGCSRWWLDKYLITAAPGSLVRSADSNEDRYHGAPLSSAERVPPPSLFFHPSHRPPRANPLPIIAGRTGISIIFRLY